MNNTAIFIPARLASTRFPEKMLADLNGKSLIRTVYDKCVATGLDTYVLTDSAQIKEEIPAEHVRITPDANNGTERCAHGVEAVSGKGFFRRASGIYKSYINVQGDMPDITEDIILAIKQGLDEGHEVVTAYTDMAPELRTDPNSVKMIHNGTHAHWFCRASLEYGDHHLGVYGYNWRTLVSYKSMPQSQEEKIEKLEQLRFLQNGVSINIRKVDFNGMEINTPEDLEKWKNMNV